MLISTYFKLIEETIILLLTSTYKNISLNQKPYVSQGGLETAFVDTMSEEIVETPRTAGRDA